MARLDDRMCPLSAVAVGVWSARVRLVLFPSVEINQFPSYLTHYRLSYIRLFLCNTSNLILDTSCNVVMHLEYRGCNLNNRIYFMIYTLYTAKDKSTRAKTCTNVEHKYRVGRVAEAVTRTFHLYFDFAINPSRFGQN
ncbi:hypothetical protein J6590_008928 [Homalodisca vitripennis]|nr:hypothetical protein J6590_008928 [Homalodisca vitripennis]